MVPKASERSINVLGGWGKGVFVFFKLFSMFFFNVRYILDLAASLGSAGCARWWR